MDAVKYPEQLVFGLDIGTRSIVGTVGYKESTNRFNVVAQVVKEHETRAMLDGQIHDIGKVAETIGAVKRELEGKIERRLTDVCIAAAGRVLKTAIATAEYVFPEETQVTDEHIHSLELMGVENAYDTIREETKQDKMKFYCVGYSVIHYYMNDHPISNLEGHKAAKIETQLIATFLPDEVVDGLYRAVERAGLYVANMTLEPIAAINVAIPERFRLLNIALVDVGAGTSDICITRDGSIIAYGMIPYAGDELTEQLAKEYLTDFQMAEHIKTACSSSEVVTYEDIMGLSHDEPVKNVLEKLNSTIERITKSVAEKIIELNGDKSVSAVFIVGGGGKIPGFAEKLADFLSIQRERVALRGEEVLGQVQFLEKGVKKDSLLVTPIGICLNFYEQKNNFIFVSVNGERVKLYDNSKLTIVDAAMQIGIQNELLFPRRGRPLEFTVNGKKRMVRGEIGEAAVITLNGAPAGINYPIVANDQIDITYSTVGKEAECTVGRLAEYQNSTIRFFFNGKKIICPKFVQASEQLVSEFYDIQEGDEIQILEYYTLEQVLEFMDIPKSGYRYYVNNVAAKPDEKIYENFTIRQEPGDLPEREFWGEDKPEEWEEEGAWEEEEDFDRTASDLQAAGASDVKKAEEPLQEIIVIVNGTPVTLSGKSSYIFVDILDFYSFDTSVAKGNNVIKMVNGVEAEFTTLLAAGDDIKLYWEN